MSDHDRHEHLPPTVAASLESRPRLPWSARVFSNIKLLIASLGAGNAVVPMGDNSRATRALASQVALVEAARRWH